jgi:hypothetical protein
VHYAGFKFQTLLLELKQKVAAYTFAREQLKTNTAIEAFGQMAYVIAFMLASPSNEDLSFADKLASHANKLAKGERAGPLETLARVAFLRGDKSKAVELQTRAIARMRSPEGKKEGEKMLDKYRRATGEPFGQAALPGSQALDSDHPSFNKKPIKTSVACSGYGA